MIKVINIVSDTNFGGVGAYLLQFLDNYDKSSIDLEIFLPFNSVLKQELIKRNTVFTEVEYINDTSFNYRAVGLLKKYFNEKKPDIVHTHAAMSGRAAAFLYGKCKIVHTRHSVFAPPKRLTRFPLKQIGGSINNLLSHRIIAVSPAAKDNLTATGTNPRKIEVIFNGCAPAEKNHDAKMLKEKYGIPCSGFVCSVVGRLEAVKGIEYIIEAAKMIDDKDIIFVIAGTGSEETALKEKAHGLNNVIFTGFVKAADIQSITDLMLNASVGTEATSFSLLEGMSMGLPAVASDFGGNPYVILDGKTGIIVPQRNPKAIKDAVMKLKTNTQLLDEYGKNALAHYSGNFTAKIMSRNIVDLYKRLGAKD